MKSKTPHLSTKRLQLVPVDKIHAADLLLLRSNERVNRFIKRNIPRDESDVLAFIADLQTSTEAGKTHYWIIEKDSRLVGSICLWKIVRPRGYAEVGYELFPLYFGSGIMTEALTEIMRYAIDEMNLKIVEAYTHRENVSSIQLLERSGFKRREVFSDSSNLNNLVFVFETDENSSDS